MNETPLNNYFKGLTEFKLHVFLSNVEDPLEHEGHEVGDREALQDSRDPHRRPRSCKNHAQVFKVFNFNMVSNARSFKLKFNFKDIEGVVKERAVLRTQNRFWNNLPFKLGCKKVSEVTEVKA